MPELTPQDATRYWLSRRTGNDLFLLYCFDEPAGSTAELRTLLIRRAAGIPDLRLRIRERRFAYPAWTPCDIADDQIVAHAVAPDWANVLVALGELVGERLDAGERAWRLHLYRGVRGGPAGAEPALIAVLQLSHALADGRRAAAIARALFAAEPAPTAISESDGDVVSRAAAERVPTMLPEPGSRYPKDLAAELGS
ncbi:wax ester/triacylglycerol synthase domain-containing protein, partial [Nocardia gipuzkoensis]